MPWKLTTGLVTGLTVTVKLLVALKLGMLLSDTTTETGLVVLAWLTSGRHVNTALVALMVFKVEFVGPVNSEKVKVGVG